MKRITIIAILASFVLTMASCGHNAELEQLRKENEELKQQLTSPSPEPESSEKKAEELFSLVKQEVYGDNIGYIETQFTIKNISDKTLSPNIDIGEYDIDGNLLSNQGRSASASIAPGEQVTIRAFHKKDYELIQQVRIVRFGYTDENNIYSSYDVTDMPFMKIYENWTKNEQMKNQ